MLCSFIEEVEVKNIQIRVPVKEIITTVKIPQTVTTKGKVLNFLWVA